LSRRPFFSALLTSAAVAAALVLAGCDTDSVAPSGRANAPLSGKMLAEIEAKQMDKGSPILMRIFKEEAEAEIWKQNRNGEFALLKTYPICRWSGELGPKVKTGDRQAPEGFYTVTPGQMNPNSSYYLSFNTGFPNSFDRAWGRTGSDLMVHGDCSSRGCYAMTDEQMVEIYALARESFFGGQRAFQLQAYPFRMTPRNMARHRNSPHVAFWKNLKQGYDHFEVTKQEPKVDVCERRYVFNAAAPEGSERPLAFSPSGKCPDYEIPKEIAELVQEKQQKDVAAIVELSASVSAAPVKRGVDGGMNPVFLAHFQGPSVDNDGRYVGTQAVPTNHVPGALPRAANNPPAQVVPPIQVAAAEAEAPVAAPADVPVPRAAPQAKQGQATESRTGLAGLIGNLFGSSSSSAQTATQPAAAPAKRPSPRTAVAASKPAKPSVTLAAAPKPTASKDEKQQAAAPAPQLRPQVKDEPAAGAKPQPQQPESQVRTAFTAQQRPATQPSVITGAQPVMPAGSFESRWSAFR
jgi:murein L,D-transpeptidase YafK